MRVNRSIVADSVAPFRRGHRLQRVARAACMPPSISPHAQPLRHARSASMSCRGHWNGDDPAIGRIAPEQLPQAADRRKWSPSERPQRLVRADAVEIVGKTATVPFAKSEPQRICLRASRRNDAIERFENAASPRHAKRAVAASASRAPCEIADRRFARRRVREQVEPLFGPQAWRARKCWPAVQVRCVVERRRRTLRRNFVENRGFSVNTVGPPSISDIARLATSRSLATRSPPPPRLP